VWRLRPRTIWRKHEPEEFMADRWSDNRARPGATQLGRDCHQPSRRESGEEC
jgi:hypothetical protein